MRSQNYARLALTLVAVAGIGAGGSLLLSLGPQPARFKYEQEWVHAFLQAGIIATLGIITSGVLERFKDGLQERRDQSKLRFDVLTELNEAYMDVELVRRKVQANNGAFTDADSDALNQAQVRVELHMRNSVPLLFAQNTLLKDSLKTMEHYLNELANRLDSEERRGFIESKEFKKFSNAYETAAGLMRCGIAGKTLAERFEKCADTVRGDEATL